MSRIRAYLYWTRINQSRASMIKGFETNGGIFQPNWSSYDDTAVILLSCCISISVNLYYPPVNAVS